MLAKVISDSAARYGLRIADVIAELGLQRIRPSDLSDPLVSDLERLADALGLKLVRSCRGPDRSLTRLRRGRLLNILKSESRWFSLDELADKAGMDHARRRLNQLVKAGIVEGRPDDWFRVTPRQSCTGRRREPS